MDSGSQDEYDEHVGSEAESLEGDEAELKRENSESPQSATGKNATTSLKSAAHLQKRRRVTRACDECRRKKIKCDGKQPCTHCTVYSYECTYDQPSNRRRNPAPQYVENLEHRVHRAEGLLHILIPNLDLNDPGIGLAVAQGWIPGAPGKGAPGAIQEQQRRQQQQQSQSTAPLFPKPGNETKADTNIESMLRAVAQLDLDETGNWGYHGHSSGLSFVRRMREQLGDLMGPDIPASPFVKSRPLSETLDSPRSNGADSPIAASFAESSSSGTELPPKAVAREACGLAIEDAAALLRVVHKPSYWRSFERLYNVPPEQYNNDDQKFLPLFYSSLALGTLFQKDTSNSSENYENAIQQGVTYFKIARQFLDIADCRGLTSIQAVVMMMLFLQSSAKLSQCYAYAGVALRSAVRMGLHRSHGQRFNPLESETRKRLFWVVRKMDIYVGAMLGLPLTLADDDIDQEFPAEVDDEYLTEEAILPMPEGQVSLMAAFNAHTRLVQILSKIVRYIYPIKMSSAEDKSYSVPFSAIREIESDLEEWKKNLPAILNPCPAPERYMRVQQLLRLTYAHAQVMLYRPFLHFVAMDKQSKPMDQRAYTCAASYVNVSRNIVHIQTQMKHQGLLNGAFWFTQYTAFFAILSLVYFAAENPDNAATEAVMKDALEGKEVLASLARRSMAADRCAATLDVVFSRLPDWMRKGQQNPINSRKRHLESQKGRQSSASRSNTEVAQSGRDGSNSSRPQRSSTFPVQNLNTASASTDNWSQSSSAQMPHTPATVDFTGSGSVNYLPFNQAGAVSNPQQFAILPDSYSNPALADISTMFPAADDPFVYPHQPLTTFENQNQHFFGANNKAAYLTSQPPFANSASPMGAGPGNAEDGMEAQFYALPPYMQRQQQHHLPQQAGGASLRQAYQSQAYGPNGWTSNSNTAAGPSGGSHQQPSQPVGYPPQSSMAGGPGPDVLAQNPINIQDIFGGTEWNPMLMTGYGGGM